MITELGQNLFVSLLAESLVVVIAIFVKGDKRKVATVLAIGTLVAGMVGFGPQLLQTIVSPPSLAIAPPTNAPTQITSCIVPNLEGLEHTAAERLISGLGLQPVINFVYNSEVSDDFVLSQEPAAQTKLTPCQGEVTIVISKGPTPTPPSTSTPLPSPTPVPPDTTPGSTLREDEIWRQNGVSLRIASREFYHVFQVCDLMDCADHKQAIRVEFILENSTGQTLLFNLSNANFSVRDDVVNSYQVYGIEVGTQNKQGFVEKEYNAPFSDGQQLYITVGSGVDVSIASRATQMTIQATNISRIVNARWKINLPR